MHARAKGVGRTVEAHVEHRLAADELLQECAQHGALSQELGQGVERRAVQREEQVAPVRDEHEVGKAWWHTARAQLGWRGTRGGIGLAAEGAQTGAHSPQRGTGL